MDLDSSSESSDSDNRCGTPPEMLKDALKIINSQLPEKSKDKYIREYEQFMSWKSEKKALSLSENVLLSYFNQKAKKYKPSSLWSIHSMLKSTLLARNNVNIQEYTKLTAFLRKLAKGYKSKKSKVFTETQINNFLHNAPDEKYLAMKVVLILGVNGACRCNELINLTTDDIETHGNMMVVKIPDNTKKRSFIISDFFYKIVQKYKNLRPSNVDTKRFLLQYKNKKCTKQVMGRNQVSAIAKKIATFLNLPNAQEYTGYSFRSTSTKLVVNTGSILNSINIEENLSTVIEEHKESNKDNAAKESDKVHEINDLVYICNACKCHISGVRYKCVQCSNYDVCAACEARGVHAFHYALRVPENSVQDEVLKLIEAIRKYLNEDPSMMRISEVKKEKAIIPEPNEERERLLEMKIELEVTGEESIKEEFEEMEECDPLSSREEQLVPRAKESCTQYTSPAQHTILTQQGPIAATYYSDIAVEKHEDLAATHHTDTAFANFRPKIVMSRTNQYEDCNTKTRNPTLTIDLIKKLLQKSRKRHLYTDKPIDATSEIKFLEETLSMGDLSSHLSIAASHKRPHKIKSDEITLEGLTNSKAGKRRRDNQCGSTAI